MTAGAQIRLASMADLDAIVELENEAWPEGTRASQGQFEERLRTYPQGFWVAEVDGRIVGAHTAQRVHYHPGDRAQGWEHDTNGGWISGSHRPDGNALHLISLGVSPAYRGLRIGTALLLASREHAVREGLSPVILDSRLPGYHDHYPRLSVVEYACAKTQGGQPLDPEVRLYWRLGFRFQPEDVVAECMADDRESVNYGVRMLWLPVVSGPLSERASEPEHSLVWTFRATEN